MEKGLIEICCGNGHGKSILAIGQSIQAAVQGKKIIIIQFLKGKEEQRLDIFERFTDWDINIFRFEKLNKYYEDLTEEEKEEEKLNVINALHFANKVITTEGCDCLILDEILGLPDNNIVPVETIINMLRAKSESMRIILTGRTLPDELRKYADRITVITAEK